MTLETITNGVVLAGVAAVFAVVAGGAVLTRRPSGRLTGTAAPFEGLSGRRLAAVTVVGWLGLAGLTVWLWIPIQVPLSGAGALIARVAGLAMFLSGAFLVLWGRRTLGPLWTVTTSKGVRLHREHRLIRQGPYAIVRHPMYLGFWLLVAGTLVIYRTWVLAAYLAVIVMRFVGRARMEERALAEAFGRDWTDYAGHVPMLIPRPHRRGRPEALS